MSKAKWGPTALIVGGSVGIGAVLAGELAKLGIDLLLVGRSMETLQSAKNRIATEYGVRVRTLACDVTEAGAVDRLIRFAAAEEVGLLAYIAGTVPAGSFL